MRISDWSSDVCSSDLVSPLQDEGRCDHEEGGASPQEAEPDDVESLREWLVLVGPAVRRQPTEERPILDLVADRVQDVSDHGDTRSGGRGQDASPGQRTDQQRESRREEGQKNGSAAGRERGG